MALQEKDIYYLIGMVSFFWVSQTRIFDLALLLITIFVVVQREQKSSKKIFVVMLIGVAIVLVYSQILEFIETFTEYSFSTENRLAAYPYIYREHLICC